MNMAEQKKILCVGLVCLDIINVVDKYPEEDSDSRLAHRLAATHSKLFHQLICLHIHTFVSFDASGKPIVLWKAAKLFFKKLLCSTDVS